MDDIEKLYEAYAKLVYKFLYCQTHDAGLSEDLMQETFYRAIGSLHKYDGSCKISVWLCQIAKHLWYQRLQKESRLKQVPLDENLRDVQNGGHRMSPEHEFFAQEDKVALYRKIRFILQETDMSITLSGAMRRNILIPLSGYGSRFMRRRQRLIGEPTVWITWMTR